MQTLLLIFVFFFGTIIGSFLNVVICRHGTGRSLGGRSKCDITGKTLKWYELIPIISFLIQGGRSRHSKTKISWKDPLVEFSTGLIFVLIFYKLSHFIYSCPETFIVNLAYYFVIFSYLILIFVYDLYHKVIPNIFLYPLTILSFVGAFFLPAGIFDVTFIELAAGPLVALPIAVIWLVSKGRGMGFGDVLLLIPLGWLLGASAGFAGLLLAFWIGAVAGILLLLKGKKTLKSEIPFGPFIVLGFAIAFLYNIDMQSIANFFSRLI